MPFKSRAQQRWMFTNNPKMAEQWAEETGDQRLPERIGKDKKQKAVQKLQRAMIGKKR